MNWLLATAAIFLSACASKPAAPTVAPPFSIEELQQPVNGEQAIRLSQPLQDASKPQIVEVLVLPGRAMEIYQIRGNVPGRGVVDLLDPSSLGNDDRGNRTFFGEGTIFGRSFATSKQMTAEQATLTGVLESEDFGGHWAGKADVAVTTALKRGSLILSIFVKNSGTDSLPITMGWHPYFSIPSGKHARTRLHLPGQGSQDQAVAELVDPGSRYGLRLKAISNEIRAFQVYAPLNESFVAIEPQSADSDLVRLPPGETTKYVVELELFAPKR